MSRADDESYYRRRAQQERAMGIACEDNAVALAHLKLADAYERRGAAANARRGRAGLHVSLAS